jgi:hypothetical protein
MDKINQTTEEKKKRVNQQGIKANEKHLFLPTWESTIPPVLDASAFEYLFA